MFIMGICTFKNENVPSTVDSLPLWCFYQWVFSEFYEKEMAFFLKLFMVNLILIHDMTFDPNEFLLIHRLESP